jgi:hypothetical protein
MRRLRHTLGAQKTKKTWATKSMDDNWPEGQGHPDDFGLEDLVQFFWAEGMGMG